MILAWSNTRSFQRHLEDMKAFRQSHDEFYNNEIALFNDMPTTYDIDLPGNTGGCRHVIKKAGRTIIVPIWKITLARDIQN